ncbi:hypothetical protein B0T14DRAFT_512803 [Immersiella caudata]|uniref:Extracellular membrane protein CFEM domain-containing protein n=1 Tax=Immersiella caudata TaxID=314043 RepID=A0AA39X565_9PEZI|nr:hypothetical protein B0T14DRAFT_512803 [Immersiella caudata]
MRCLPTSLLALLAASVTGVVAVVDFSFYPVVAQDCMYKASNSSKCSETSVAETNKCLCSDGGNFVTNTAKCLGTANNVKSSDIQTVYDTMKQACSDSKTPLSVSEKAFLNAAKPPTTTSKVTSKASTTTSTSSTSTSTSVTTTTEATPAPTGSKDPQNTQPEQENAGLSSGAKIGIIAGGAVAGVAVLAAVAILLLRRKRRRDGEESHPMLSQSHNYPTPGETVVVGHDMGRHSGATWTDDAKWRPAASPDPRNSTFNWETPYDPTGSPPTKQGFPTPPPLHQGFPTPQPPLQQVFSTQQYKAYQPPLPSPQPMPAQPQVFELGSSQLPAEAPGSTIPVSTAVEMEGTPALPHGFDPRPQQGYPSQFGSGGYR